MPLPHPTSAEAAMLEQGAWQPIETAPKDGTPVRLKSAAYDPAEYAFIWDKREAKWMTRVFAVAASYPAWWSEDCEPPTHWMPLPEPPGAGK